MKSSCHAKFSAPNDQIALFLNHLWATDGSVRWDEKVRQGRIYYASTSRRLIDDVAQLLLRLASSAESIESPSGGTETRGICTSSAPTIRGDFFETWVPTA